MQINFEGMNPNIKESSTKAGIIRRVSFEVDQETYDAIKQYNLKGMIVSGNLEIIEGELFENGGAPKGGKNSVGAAMLCKRIPFQLYVYQINGFEASEKNAIEYLKGYCGIESRKELDNNEHAMKLFLSLVNNFNEYLKNGESQKQKIA
jgi:hypothetical protein